MGRKGQPIWWGYVKGILRQYPRWKRQAERPIDPEEIGAPAPSLDGMPRSGRISSPTEHQVLNRIPPRIQRQVDAVDKAIQETRRLDHAEIRLEIIRLVYFERHTTIEGAAMRLHIHANTAGRWQAQFIRRVANHLDL